MLRIIWRMIGAIVKLLMSKSGGSRFSGEYQQFIKSPEWKNKRLKILTRDGHKCRKCGSKGSKGNALQVDHIRYPKRGASVAAFKSQRLVDLQTLCARCHQAKTRSDRANRNKRG